MALDNIFQSIPAHLDDEIFDCIVQHGDVKIERIVSKGHTSPESGWYDQPRHEWVIVLKGEAIITFMNEDVFNLKAGDFVNIPAHTKHKVSWTKPDDETVWLAVHY